MAVFVIVAVATATTRETMDYHYFATQLKVATGVKALIYGTDGEPALEKAMEEVFPASRFFTPNSSVRLRCFGHLRDDMKMEMEKQGIDSNLIKDIIQQILGSEGGGKRTMGLVDLRISDFDEEYDRCAFTWPLDFKLYMASKHNKIMPNREILKWHMSSEVRTAAGLGDPATKFTNNNAEMANSLVKESIHRQKVDQATFHQLCLHNAIEPMEYELKQAIFNTGEYRLAPAYQHMSVDPCTWKNMTAQQKEQKAKRILHATVSTPEKVAVKARNEVISRHLSQKPEDYHEELADIPMLKLQSIWDKAEVILSNYEVEELKSGNFSVKEYDRVTNVARKASSFSCECSSFKELAICQHVLCVAEVCKKLQQFLQSYQLNVNKILSNSPKSAGKKTNQKGRKGKQNVKSATLVQQVPFARTPQAQANLNELQPYRFTEVYQNDHPFVLTFVDDLKKSKGPKKVLSCASCLCEIPMKSPSPYNIVFVHSERWKYWDRATGQEQVSLKTTSKIYCTQKNCILKRHPHFWNGLIEIAEATLQRLDESHNQLLKWQFDYDL